MFKFIHKKGFINTLYNIMKNASDVEVQNINITRNAVFKNPGVLMKVLPGGGYSKDLAAYLYVDGGDIYVHVRAGSAITKQASTGEINVININSEYQYPTPLPANYDGVLYLKLKYKAVLSREVYYDKDYSDNGYTFQEDSYEWILDDNLPNVHESEIGIAKLVNTDGVWNLEDIRVMAELRSVYQGVIQNITLTMSEISVRDEYIQQIDGNNVIDLSGIRRYLGMRVSWNYVGNATHYEVFAVENRTGGNIYYGVTSGNSILVPANVAGVQWTIKVRALNENGNISEYKETTWVFMNNSAVVHPTIGSTTDYDICVSVGPYPNVSLVDNPFWSIHMAIKKSYVNSNSNLESICLQLVPMSAAPGLNYEYRQLRMLKLTVDEICRENLPQGGGGGDFYPLGAFVIPFGSVIGNNVVYRLRVGVYNKDGLFSGFSAWYTITGSGVTPPEAPTNGVKRPIVDGMGIDWAWSGTDEIRGFAIFVKYSSGAPGADKKYLVDIVGPDVRSYDFLAAIPAGTDQEIVVSFSVCAIGLDGTYSEPLNIENCKIIPSKTDIKALNAEIVTARKSYSSLDERILAFSKAGVDWENVRIVAKSGGHYDTIQAAIDSISYRKNCIIWVIGPGKWEESLMFKGYNGEPRFIKLIGNRATLYGSITVNMPGDLVLIDNFKMVNSDDLLICSSYTNETDFKLVINRCSLWAAANVILKNAIYGIQNLPLKLLNSFVKGNLMLQVRGDSGMYASIVNNKINGSIIICENVIGGTNFNFDIHNNTFTANAPCVTVSSEVTGVNVAFTMNRYAVAPVTDYGNWSFGVWDSNNVNILNADLLNFNDEYWEEELWD